MTVHTDPGTLVSFSKGGGGGWKQTRVLLFRSFENCSERKKRFSDTNDFH